MDISVVIPLLNEAESLPELFSWIEKVMQENNFTYEIIAVDDGSTDNSWEIIQNLSKENQNIKGIRFQRNYGKSAALQTAFQATNGNVVITMDADLQDSPDEIPELYSMIVREKYHLVSGWKQERFDNKLTKNLPSKLFNFVTQQVSGIKNLHDFNCGLKAYNSEVVKNIEIYGEMHRYIPVIAKWAGYSKITEKPVKHQKRKYGVTKFGIERFINGFLDLLSITFVGRFGKRPMHLFGVLGTLSFFFGFVILIYMAYSKLILGEAGMANRPLFYLGILTVIVGTQLFLAGFLGELIARNSNERNLYNIKETLGLS
ncbi:MAG TPA: glycosyltransferase family 2 protein [Chitinophagales bacterium]|nr:glycosyltransferase family 2 protein [Chitinophagales bacterium]MCB9075118.1 glycosyltransferase family 2 protein [Chitinophagales bacterium]HMU97937.1 glycosyltransferase family 2 protein [Chitinophagales bacterium]HMV02938.1 glycosyltransferase family 2 protein [Chitinophagales bacterium]HMW93540.1 glycosyltransferase family 2 protein [Chitinophagales bacterium]